MSYTTDTLATYIELLKVPEKPKLKCMGFTYNGPKLFNMLPPQMRETKYLQNYDEKLDIGKNTFILVITI